MVQNKFAGEETEDTKTVDALASALRKRGIGVRSLPKFHIRSAGRVRLSKPDLELTNGGVHIISAKFGEEKTFEAYRTATSYKTEIPVAIEMAGRQIGEVFAVTYPAKRHETFHLYILPREGRHRDIPLALTTVREVADKIVDAVKGRFDELAQRAEPVTSALRRILYQGALELADTFEDVEEKELETVFGGHDFFKSVLATRLKGEQRKIALRRGPSFLFVNQVLFYVLLSNADRITGNKNFPLIREKDTSQPETLQKEYFDRVRNRNYEPIYGIDLTHLLAGQKAKDACRDVVKTVQDFAPSLDTPDLAGQVFQTLIPHEIRKPLGAHYTNPKAAALLAGLTVTNPGATVLDPACGSGTLLVAAYRRKKDCFANFVPRDYHRRFVEEDITGLDAMAFSGHLAAVNLALQSPLQDTEHVRIGTCDSTVKRPGDFIAPTEEALSYELKQTSLMDRFDTVSDGSKRHIKGPVKTSASEARPFQLQQVDLVIMNPPFTSWDNMASEYRNGLVRLFSGERPAYAETLYWKTSQQTFFLLLADRFLKAGGTVAAVLPITTFTGKAFEPLMKFFLANYTVRYIIIGLGRASFSEQTQLSECLFVAQKTAPPTDSSFHLMATLKSPTAWSDLTVETMVDRSEHGLASDDSLITSFPQASLRPDKETLSGLIFRLIPEFRTAIATAEEIENRSTVPFVPISTLMDERGVEVSRWILGGGYLAGYAPKAFFAFRTEYRAVRDIDRLLIQSEGGTFYSLIDRKDRSTAKLRKEIFVPALRRITHLASIEVTKITDLCVFRPDPTVRELVNRYYGRENGERRWKRITDGGKETLGPWKTVIPRGTCKLALARRLGLAGPGSTLICCRSSEPFFLAADGFMVRGLSPEQEKLFCLWLNSSYVLLKLIERSTITHGSWIKLERFRYRGIKVPDYEKLNPEQKRTVDQLYSQLAGESLPDFMKQLKAVTGFRAALDAGLLSLIGISKSDAERIGVNIRSGILSAITTLEKTLEH